LLCAVNDILSTQDNDSISVPLFNLSAAFDITDHQILLFCLNSVLGIQSTAALHSNGFNHTSQADIRPL